MVVDGFAVAELSFPTRERGLKSEDQIEQLKSNFVVPHAGTWIEIQVIIAYRNFRMVVPHAGTWIEIPDSIKKLSISLVVPHAGTWIEIT